MTEHTTLPHGENLRNAIRWLSQQSLNQQCTGNEPHSRETIEKASLLFDLTPLEEEFLIRKFSKKD
ncbi:MAG: hypothetical protein PVF82_07510 [Gammaproteobacteria bacterium]|jgi:hypothetical protein